jgi:ATP/maltotriose-dependent transcriptional regulator MalT
MKQRQTIRVNGAFSDAMGIGYIVLDACGGILYNNDAFLSYGTQLSNKHDLSSLAHELIEKVRVSGKETLGDCRIKSLNIDELTLIVRHKTIPMATGIKKYTLLAIYANKPQVAPGDLRAHFMERYNLTPREAEIMVLMVRGLDNNELSASLFVSMSTIKTHIRNIYSKLEVSSRTELLRKIKQHTSADAN